MSTDDINKNIAKAYAEMYNKPEAQEIVEVDINEDNTNDVSDDGDGMDKVQPKALKKKFKDRKDKDLDNDGDEDESDEYLHNRRKTVKKAVDKKDDASVLEYSKEELQVKLEASDLDEISKKTLGSYIKKSVKDIEQQDHDSYVYAKKAGRLSDRGDARGAGRMDKAANRADDKSQNRKRYIGKAADKLTKEGTTKEEGIIDRMLAGRNKEGSKKWVTKKPQTKESVELDELSRKTLGSYAQKAMSDVDKQKADADKFEKRGMAAKNPGVMDKNFKKSNRASDKASNRKAGINKAIDKMAKESVEPGFLMKRIQEKATANNISKDDTRDSFDKQLAGRRIDDVAPASSGMTEAEFVKMHSPENANTPEFADAPVVFAKTLQAVKDSVKSKSPIRHNDSTIGESVEESMEKGMPPGEHVFDKKVDGKEIMVHKLDKSGKFCAYVDGKKIGEYDDLKSAKSAAMDSMKEDADLDEAIEKEGNMFTKALMAARKNGDKKFIVGTKSYNTEDYADKAVKEENGMYEGMTPMQRALAKVKAQSKDKVSVKKAPWDKDDVKKEDVDLDEAMSAKDLDLKFNILGDNLPYFIKQSKGAETDWYSNLNRTMKTLESDLKDRKDLHLGHARRYMDVKGHHEASLKAIADVRSKLKNVVKAFDKAFYEASAVDKEIIRADEKKKAFRK